jgi:flagellar M-ring protein FliF
VPPLLQTGPAQKEAGLPVYPQSGSEGETLTEETGSYAVTRHLLHSEEGPGRIRRVTVAVVVNDRMTTEGTGKTAHAVWKPRGQDEMQRLEQLARAAVGFDTTRGDEVVVENVSFSSNAPEATPEGMAKAMDETDALLHAQPGLLKTVCFAVLSLLLVLTVVKPMSRHMMTALSQAPALALPATTGAQAGRGADGKTIGQTGGSGGPNFVLPAKRPNDAQGMYEHISEQIRREPAQSTRVLESWINAPAEEQD